MKAIINANVVLEHGILYDGVILTDGATIAHVGKARDTETPENAEIIDANGAYVGPGFVDIHIHGAPGKAFFKDPVGAAKYFLKHGETSLLATSTGQVRGYEEWLEGIEKILAAMQTEKNIKGLNFEGPYLSNKYGAGKGSNAWSYQGIFEEEYKPIFDMAGTALKLMSVAPEREDILKAISYAKSVNPSLKLAVAHSEATPEQIRALGPQNRPALSTHIFNATGRIGGNGGIRGRGPDEYCLANPDMYAELICDSQGIHVHPELIRMLIETKGIHRIVLITDSTPYEGFKSERFPDADDLNFNELGRLAGSKMTLSQACRNLMTHSTCGIAQAFLMASLNPARVVGMDGEIGSIEVGKKADFVFVDDRFNVLHVISEGESVEL